MLDMLERVLAAWRGNLCVGNYSCAGVADEGGLREAAGISQPVNASMLRLRVFLCM
jgi:hypothetical protein